MPRRRTTRTQDRAHRINDERARNQTIDEDPENTSHGGKSAIRDGEDDDPAPF
jgi:hypothetical protein